MITVGSAHKNHIHLSAFAYPGEGKAPQPGKMIYWQAFSVNHQLLTEGCNPERILF
jgi:hypothetical protein